MYTERRIILLINTARGFERSLIRGVAKYSAIHGPWIFYRQTPFYRKSQESETLLSRLKNWNADGIIMRENQYMDDILSLGLPTIVAAYSKKLPNTPQILSNNTEVGKIASNHLTEHGFRNFAYCGFDDQYWSIERGNGFRENLQQNGFKTHFYHAPTSMRERLWENEPYHMARWLAVLPKPVGILTCTDERAQQIIEAAHIANLTVPDEVAVIGVDNDEMICEITRPTLTSIDIGSEKAGYEAAALLDKMINGSQKKVKNVVGHPITIHMRESTDIIAIEDQDVRTALHYIYEKAPIESLKVQDVVNQTTVSRRMLENKFNKLLKRTILHEIKRVRIQQISKLLLESKMNISEIAVATGFKSIQNISRYFSETVGISPVEYRKKHVV
jgi:LacI family transcriptional regulator